MWVKTVYFLYSIILFELKLESMVYPLKKSIAISHKTSRGKWSPGRQCRLLKGSRYFGLNLVKITKNINFVLFFCHFLPFWTKPIGQIRIFFGPRLETGGTYRISPVRACVHACAAAFLQNGSKDFSETWYEVRHP